MTINTESSTVCSWDFCGTPGLRGIARATVLCTQLCAVSEPDSEGDSHLCLTVAPPLNVASTAALVCDALRSEHEPGVKAATVYVAVHPVTGPAFLLCCFVIGLLLRLRSNRASALGVALHGSKPRQARDACVWRRAAGLPRPHSASCSQRFGARRAIPLLLLVAWLGICSANDLAHVPPSPPPPTTCVASDPFSQCACKAGQKLEKIFDVNCCSDTIGWVCPDSTSCCKADNFKPPPLEVPGRSAQAGFDGPDYVHQTRSEPPERSPVCSVLPWVCDGTYNGTELCACSSPCPARAPRPTVSILASERAIEEYAPSPSPTFVPLSQEACRQRRARDFSQPGTARGDRVLAHDARVLANAARGSRRFDDPVSHCSSVAHLYAAVGGQERGEGALQACCALTESSTPPPTLQEHRRLWSGLLRRILPTKRELAHAAWGIHCVEDPVSHSTSAPTLCTVVGSWGAGPSG